jgi:bifunctional non-homologous end joining protein LigD
MKRSRLKAYRGKRRFTKTTEPAGTDKIKSSTGLRFVVQEHHASHLHYDFRLEMNGVLKSWAVPKGPSMNPNDKRLAIMVEDHPFEYKDFEGVIPAGNYGAGRVIIWDKGVYELTGKSSIAKGHLSFILHGKKLRGEFSLVKLKNAKQNSWLLIKKKVMPEKISPMLAHLAAKPFTRKGWIFEIKWDGYRIIAHVQDKNVTLYSRSHQDYTQIFSPVSRALAKQNINAILDGEMVVLDEKGQAHFQLLQQFQKTQQGDLVYYVFDLLWLNGDDLRELPLAERKKKLIKLLHPNAKIRISEHVATDGEAFFKVAAQQGLEGIMAKDIDSPYFSGKRSQSWLKMKAVHQEEAIIAGYTAPRGSRQHIGSLILGMFKGKELVYIGHSSGKLSEQGLADLKKKLDSLARVTSPFKNPPKTNAPVTWVKPTLVCEVNFTEWTEDGHLRHPVFIGLRQDKPARTVHREKIITDSQLISCGNHRVKLSHLTKIYFPADGYTKKDLIDYYRSMAPVILPHLKDRPEALHRYPNGIEQPDFFQKNVTNMPEWIKTRIFYSENKSKAVKYLLCQNEATLIYMVNLGCIEINPWLARIQTPDQPDFCVLDLDPENISFAEVITTAKTIHTILEKAGIANFCKTSGKRGMHIYIPLGGRYDFNQSRQLAEIIAILAHNRLPETTSLTRSPALRQGKVYIDYLQNRAHQTVASPYSVRPRPGATVSTPLHWREVTRRLDPGQFTIKNMLKRIEKNDDIWKEILKSSINMRKALAELKKLISSEKEEV